MATFEYSTRIGDYNDPVRLDVTVKLGTALHSDDYTKLTDALAVVELMALKYRDIIYAQDAQANDELAELAQTNIS